jgi:CDGSH-type Zn-finger protein/truncated hemoglobin YjbI
MEETGRGKLATKDAGPDMSKSAGQGTTAGQGSGVEQDSLGRPGSGVEQGSVAGQGRLAQVIATRGGKAAPEAPFVIEHREALIYMLCEAAELEHGIMCQYLFAAFSLKQSAEEGLTEAQVAAVTRWRKQVLHVAAQEMLHLALVHNLMSAIGGAPHLSRPNLPQPVDHYPAGVQLALLPFGEQALRHFMFLERPEGMDLQDAEGLAAMGRAEPLMNERDIVPRRQDFATVGHLYRSIEAGVARLAEKNGPDWLFVGPPKAQATPAHFQWPELVEVTDAASAQRAIDTILEQGEGPRGEWRNAHFGQFVEILDEYLQLTEEDPAFEPVRPVIAANVRPPERDVEVPLITDPLTARLTDLFNVAYEILLLALERYFAHTEETDAQLKVLADLAVGLMLQVIKPLGDLITTLPVGPGVPGKNAGPSFELFYESDYLMPHREAAWALLTERLNEAAWLCGALQEGRGAQLAGQLDPILGALGELARTLAVHLPAGSAQARLARQAAPLPPAQADELLARADGLAQGVAAGPRRSDAAARMADVFEMARSVMTAAARSAVSGVVLPRITDSVLRPLADELARYPAGGEQTAAGDQTAAARAAGGEEAAGEQQPSRPGAPAGVPVSELVWQAAEAATRLRARLGAAGTAPPGLAEAAAALQDLACQLAPAGEQAGRLASLWQIQHGLPPEVQVAADGPYLVTNVPWVLDHLGQPVQTAVQLDPPQPAAPQPAPQPPASPQLASPQLAPPKLASPQLAPPQLALCRCGGSSMKPLCDGTHARNGFSGAKDPKRVPDRRDSYPGQEVTILDNRGLCQHSGLCTDRLSAVFRTGQEPFVAPSGGRLDEIIRSVRDCPSGALSLELGGPEARGVVDWPGQREPAIEVTKDGPYRITGGIALTGADGRLAERNQGASTEHYALCRCGHSQNKPFCSGMHWYVAFHDPEPSPGTEPSLFEWAGGLPGLTRMTRLLYEKHVPGDSLLARVFSNMPAGHPEREAAWLAEVFGGPAFYSRDRGGSQQMVAAHAGCALTEEQRARWVTLATRAADDAGLPTDAAFRSAFSGYLEWGSRVAAEMSQPGAAPPAEAPMPRWGWTAAGPPSVPVAPDDQGEQQAPRPGPDEAVSFATHIKPLFRERDRQSMSFAFDLWSYDDVRAHAAGILEQVRGGSMPCDGAWNAGKVDVFQRWADSGLRP